MKKLLSLFVGLALFAGLAVEASADEALKRAVKARKASMQLQAFNIGQLGAMAKGDMAFDAKVAQAAADNLVAIANMNGAAMWPQGSGADNPALKGMTRAKPEIWSTYPKIVEASKAFKVAAEQMAANAGTLDGVRASIRALGGSCGGCHKPFRLPES